MTRTCAMDKNAVTKSQMIIEYRRRRKPEARNSIARSTDGIPLITFVFFLRKNTRLISKSSSSTSHWTTLSAVSIWDIEKQSLYFAEGCRIYWPSYRNARNLLQGAWHKICEGAYWQGCRMASWCSALWMLGWYWYLGILWLHVPWSSPTRKQM